MSFQWKSGVIAVVRYAGGDTILLPVQISRSLVARLHPGIVANNPRYYRREVGPSGFELMETLHRIEGLEDLCFYTHSMTVYCKREAKRAEVIAAILDILKSHVATLLGAPASVEEIEVVEIAENRLEVEDYHPDDSGRPGFHMPA